MRGRRVLTSSECLRATALDLPIIRHGFFTRQGGVSEGIFASLNCGFGSSDDAAKVAENRVRAMAVLGLSGDRLATCYQVHSAEVVVVDRPWPRDQRPRADAMVTRTPEIALGILTADCAPVLFADAEARVIGAAHAGWRGALSGVLEATVEAMKKLGATPPRIHAAIGPCIGWNSYEVGPEFPAPFLAENAANASFFRPAPREGHFLFDLAGYGAARLKRLGLAPIETIPGNTAAEAARFFSYRRSCRRKEPDYGRELSAIALAP
ncbi:MAG TPA: peptidoglycan editing factor PgeF [Stellaceae bacterium]|nr:peptidoglycan editing factor PgeF [Stellaceae bacterium]